MLRVALFYCYAECRKVLLFAECHYIDCHYVEYCGTASPLVIFEGNDLLALLESVLHTAYA
jgi:hypothetical protein